MKKVLVIEDNDDIREGTVEVLTLAGYEALSAKNGKLGVEMALSTSPDIILCDIMMPELDGYGVLYLLSKNPKLASIPFIFMTAKAERADMRKGMEMGADDYLTKPFDDLELFNAIESRLKKKSQTVGFKAAPKDLQTIFAELKQRGTLSNLKLGQIYTHAQLNTIKPLHPISVTLNPDLGFCGDHNTSPSTNFNSKRRSRRLFLPFGRSKGSANARHKGRQA